MEGNRSIQCAKTLTLYSCLVVCVVEKGLEREKKDIMYGGHNVIRHLISWMGYVVGYRPYCSYINIF